MILIYKLLWEMYALKSSCSKLLSWMCLRNAVRDWEREQLQAAWRQIQILFSRQVSALCCCIILHYQNRWCSIWPACHPWSPHNLGFILVPGSTSFSCLDTAKVLGSSTTQIYYSYRSWKTKYSAYVSCNMLTSMIIVRVFITWLMLIQSRTTPTLNIM